VTEREQISHLRMGLSIAIGYLSHFKDDAEGGVVSSPDTIQKAMDDLQGVLNGGRAGDVFRASGDIPALKSAVLS
jgi:hypothetical protein